MPAPLARPLRRAAPTLAAALALALAAATAAPAQDGPDFRAMTPEQRQIFRDEVRAYLLDHPEVLVEAIQELERRQSVARSASDADLLAANRAALFDDGHSFVGGNPEGDITLIEFLDYRCSFCRRAHPEIANLLAGDGNIRWIVKEFPILGADSTLSSRFAIAVLQTAGAAAYAEVHDRLMTLRAQVTPEALARIAAEAGADADAVLARMDAPEVSAVIAANHALAQRLGINGTPTFVLEDSFLRGYVPLDTMQALVAEARGG